MDQYLPPQAMDQHSTMTGSHGNFHKLRIPRTARHRTPGWLPWLAFPKPHRSGTMSLFLTASRLSLPAANTASRAPASGPQAPKMGRCTGEDTTSQSTAQRTDERSRHEGLSLYAAAHLSWGLLLPCYRSEYSETVNESLATMLVLVLADKQVLELGPPPTSGRTAEARHSNKEQKVHAASWLQVHRCASQPCGGQGQANYKQCGVSRCIVTQAFQSASEASSFLNCGTSYSK